MMWSVLAGIDWGHGQLSWAFYTVNAVRMTLSMDVLSQVELNRVIGSCCGVFYTVNAVRMTVWIDVVDQVVLNGVMGGCGGAAEDMAARVEVPPSPEAARASGAQPSVSGAAAVLRRVR